MSEQIEGRDGDRSREDRLVTEEPLEIRVGWPGRPAETAWLTMRTPGHDFELAAGWAMHEGILTDGALDRIAYCTDGGLTAEQEFNVVTLTLTATPPVRPGRRHLDATVTSACGVCGKDSIDAVMATPSWRPWVGDLPGAEVVRQLPTLLREHQTLFGRTGGSHAAGLFDATGRLMVAREDVGRHNAVDKVIGARILTGEDPGAAVIVVSGRAGFELVQKAVVAGMGALVAVGAPTSLSVDLARSAGLALFGFTTSQRSVQYA